MDGAARILVVDDEAALLRLVTSYLSRIGYCVSGCSTAAAALELFQSDPQAFSLAIVDLTLPDRPGDQLAVDFLRLSADVRILLFSGFVVTDERIPPDFRNRVGAVQKPFVPQALADEARRLLAG